MAPVQKRAWPRLIAAVSLLGLGMPAAVAYSAGQALGRWTVGTPMTVGRSYAAAAVDRSGRIYAIGGAQQNRAETERFVPSKKRWERIAPMQTPVQAPAAATDTSGRIYVIGGFGASAGYWQALNTVERYDPKTKTWESVASMPTARSSLAAATGRDGMIYVLGGYSIEVLTVAERYNPRTNKWTALPPMPNPHSYFSAVVDAKGRIYAVAGKPSFNSLERYDPKSRKWQALAPIPAICSETPAVMGRDGKIYVIGCDSETGRNKVERYAPGKNSWQTVAPMPTARGGVAAAVGKDGRIYAMGGWTQQENALKTVEVYTPPSSRTS